MRLAFVLDGLENTILATKSTAVASTEERKARLLLIKEISDLLDSVKMEVTIELAQGVASNNEWDRINNNDEQVKDLMTRTKELIKVLQVEDN